MSVRARLGEYYVKRRPGWRVLWWGALLSHQAGELAHSLTVDRTLRRQVSQATSLHPPLQLVFATVEKPLVSIVIPVFNNWPLTRSCLAALRARTAGVPVEVILVDDHSDDETAAAAGTVQGLVVLRNETNLGFTKSANRGAAAARGEHVLFLNNDALLLPRSMENLLEVMQDGSVGAVGASLLAPSGRLREAGSLVWQDGTCSNIGRGCRPSSPQFMFRRDVDYCSGAALLVRASVLRRVGCFDERFTPAYYEDVDLCFSIRAAGQRVVCEPSAPAVHLEGMTHGTDLRPALAGATTKQSDQAVNRVKFVEKWSGELKSHSPPPQDIRRGELLGSRKDPLPRVLVCDWVIPAADRDSTSHRMDAILRLLPAMSSLVTFVPKVRGANFQYAGRLRELGVEVLCPAPRSFERFMRSRSDLYDLVVLSRMAVAREWLKTVRRHQPRAKVVFDTVDLHSVRYERERDATGASPGDDPERTREIERGLIAQADLTAAITETEAALVREMSPSASILVLPNVHEVPNGEPPGPAGRRGLLFIGSFLHTPNTDAVAWMAGEVLPRIRAQLDVSLVVIGEDPPPSLVRSSGPHVSFVGWVPDVRPLFDSARVFVAPLRFGAGMKGKLGQSLALGLPAVSTSVGVEGMDLEDGSDVLIRDGVEEFAEGVCTLYTDDGLWSRLSKSGRDAVRARWGPDSMRSRLASLLAEAQPR